MSRDQDAGRFQDAVLQVQQEFQAFQSAIEQEQGGEEGPILERRARRYLVDRYLLALGWDTNNPKYVQEEGRGTGEKVEEKLFFDFLGWNPNSAVPALLVEAKLFGHERPRLPGGQALNLEVMAVELAKAINGVKKNGKSHLLAVWTKILGEMKTYVQALARADGEGPYRAIITSGDWIIVFSNPVETFGKGTTADASQIHCYMGFGEIHAKAGEIFDFLNRSNLVDTLPVILGVQEALKILPPDVISACRKGVYLGTRNTGPQRSEYPHRSVYPTVIVNVAGREIGICDLEAPLEAPRKEAKWSGFFAEVDAEGDKLLHRLDERMSSTLKPKLAGGVVPFVVKKPTQQISALRAPTKGSTANFIKAIERPAYRIKIDDGNGPFYLVGTGAAWYYRGDNQRAVGCRYHSHEAATQDNVNQPSKHPGYSRSSFTKAPEVGHCAQGDLLSSRSDRCQVEEFDSHLCCQGCVFVEVCWKADDKLPCPAPLTPVAVTA